MLAFIADQLMDDYRCKNRLDFYNNGVEICPLWDKINWMCDGLHSIQQPNLPQFLRWSLTMSKQRPVQSC
jgi:hypothetical protein